jgi:4-alpha-glucanotransferase
MPFPRTSGILLHPTCFPGPDGIGDLGEPARQFIDFLADSGQEIWQILPLGPTGYGNSPYMSFSAIAGNPLLISLDLLAEQGWLSPEDLHRRPGFDLDFIEFDRAIAWKMPLLRKASLTFRDKASVKQQTQFESFCHVKAHWLEDFALFMAILEAKPGTVWTDWPKPLRDRDEEALQQARQDFGDEIHCQKFMQFEFFRQWTALKEYANQNHIQVFGDIPIYVAFNSSDVWANPHLFQLDAEKQPIVVAGVPPDYFAETGQRWGNPLYDWAVLEATGFVWWIIRLREGLELVDLLRIDHFRGFANYWAVPAEEETAENGKWIDGPGAKLFNAIHDALGNLPIIAEDLGDIDQSVIDLRHQFGFPGMKILHFAFGGGSDNPFHDNDTTLGWYKTAPDYERERLHQYLGCNGSDGIVWDLIRLALSSVANQAIIPFQDLCSLGTDARMNLPGTAEGNWGWRYRPEALTEEYSDRLRALTQIYGRYHDRPKADPQEDTEPNSN